MDCPEPGPCDAVRCLFPHGLYGPAHRLWLSDPATRALWLETEARLRAEGCQAWEPPPGPPPRPPAEVLRCRHLGADTGRTEGCRTCTGTVRLKLFACAHPAAGPETTLRRCQACAYFDPRPPLPPPAPPG
jgi:hypothetical protein